MAEIKQEVTPCPFCGSRDIKPLRQSGADIFLHATCFCGASGPGRISPEEAITAWNQRAEGTDAEVRRLQDRVHWLEGQNKRLQEILDGWQVETYGDY